MAIIGALKRVKLLVVSVSNRVVSLCLCRTYDQAERQVVLPAVYSREKEEGLVQLTIGSVCSTFRHVCRPMEKPSKCHSIVFREITH